MLEAAFLAENIINLETAITIQSRSKEEFVIYIGSLGR